MKKHVKTISKNPWFHLANRVWCVSKLAQFGPNLKTETNLPKLPKATHIKGFSPVSGQIPVLVIQFRSKLPKLAEKPCVSRGEQF
ncbi:MAG: hypothetical protein AB2669_08460 [Candidatus Thiodiazotropha endolucinida]